MKLFRNKEAWDNDPSHKDALITMFCCGYVFHRRCLDQMEKKAEEDLRKG